MKVTKVLSMNVEKTIENIIAKCDNYIDPQLAVCIIRDNYTMGSNNIDELKKYDSEDIFVIGGESIYRQLLPYCTKAYITKIDHAYDADTYFPNLDERPEWKITADSEEQTYFDLEYYFYRYERVK